MSNRWPGGIINGTAPVPTGGGAGDSAPGVWTIDQADQYIAVQEWPGTGIPDPQFQYVTALLHGDGTNGGQNNTFLDSSSNNFTITRNGNTTQGSFSPYGNLWSNFFNGSSNLTLGGQSAFAFGTGDWTVSFWLNLNTTSGNQTIFDTRPSGTGNSTNYMILQASSGSLNYYTSGAGTSIDGADLSAGVWYWVELSKVSGNTRLFVNGSQSGATYSDSQNYVVGASRPIIANDGFQLNTPVNGYISNFRMVKGSGITSSTVPTSPLTAITNTSLLTCQSNRFIDNSTNNFTVTLGGTPSVQRFSPFQNLATYQPAVIGGSGYFDGAGDWLQTPSNAAFNFSSTDCTIEFWFNGSTSGGLALEWGTGASGDMQIEIFSGGMTFGPSGGATKTFFPIIANAWNHIAAVKTGTTYYLYINGTRNTTSSGTAASSAQIVNIGCRNGGTVPITGYLSNLRISNIAVYTTSTLTVPTAPVGTTANTQLLTNFTNGAIFDSDASNNFETVGNAQISTSVVKYGTGSMAFDGSGDVLSTPYNPSFNFSGNFTIECWVYFNSLASIGTVWSQNSGGTFFILHSSVSGSNALGLYIDTLGGSPAIQSAALSTGVWYHVALSRVGGVFRLFVNGNLQGTFTNTGNPTPSGTPSFFVGNNNASSGAPLNGYVDDFRVTQGYARYWYNFQPPTRAFPNYGGTLIEANDPLFVYNTLLLSGNGTNGAQNNTFLDSSTNNFTITRNGNTTQGSFSPYGTLWSNFFNGSGNYLTVPSNAAFNIEGGAYTIEFFAFYNGFTGGDRFFVMTGSSQTFGLLVGTSSANDIEINQFGTGTVLTGTNALNGLSNKWMHICVVSNGTNRSIFVNGTRFATTTSALFQSSNNAVGIAGVGGTYAGNNPNGYISNFRVVKGTAVYNPTQTTLTVPTVPLTAITNTSLLTCADNRFIDDSTNNFTITPVGSPSIQRFSPFEPTAPYSTSVIGGSGYFDGTGDSLSVANNTALEFGSGDFTIETFVYFNSLATNRGIVYLGTDPNSNFSYGLQWSGNVLYFWYTTNGSDLTNKNASWTPVISTWYHVAVTRSGNDLRFFVDGAQIGTTQSMSGVTIFDSTSAMLIGGEATGSPTSLPGPMNGYISNLRILKGTALYTGSYTIPTAPLTAITNTSLLTNMTNAGIPDLAMMNNLETVGNAQVSTAQSKFGGSSLAFDGSGDALALPANINLSVGSGDFTIEMWVYGANNGSPVGGSFPRLFTLGTAQGTGCIEVYNGSGTMTVEISATPTITFTASILLNSAWNHFAVTRSGTSLRAFVNGTQVGSATNSTNLNLAATTQSWIGAISSSAGNFNGFIQDLRITKGIARYVQPFTPPTQAFQTY